MENEFRLYKLLMCFLRDAEKYKKKFVISPLQHYLTYNNFLTGMNLCHPIEKSIRIGSYFTNKKKFMIESGIAVDEE